MKFIAKTPRTNHHRIRGVMASSFYLVVGIFGYIGAGVVYILTLRRPDVPQDPGPPWMILYGIIGISNMFFFSALLIKIIAQGIREGKGTSKNSGRGDSK